jgi:hypothetical protein
MGGDPTSKPISEFSTPISREWSGGVSAMLAGSWRASAGDTIYLGSLDPVTGEGLCEIRTAGSKVYRHTYRIRSADEAVRTAVIEILFEESYTPPAMQQWTLSADGGTAQRRLLGGGGFSLMNFVRLAPSAEDTLTYMGKDQALGA